MNLDQTNNHKLDIILERNTFFFNHEDPDREWIKGRLTSGEKQ